MQLSVVICTHNKIDYLEAVLFNLQNQERLKGVEIILIADGCTDNTSDFLKSHTFKYRFKYKCIPQSGLATARNQGIRLSEGKHILFMDDDILLAPDYFKKLLASLNVYPNHIHSGNLYNVRMDAVPSICETIHNLSQVATSTLDKEILKTDFIYEIPRIIHRKGEKRHTQVACWWALVTGGNMCLSREILEEIGYFEEHFKSWAPEDIDLCYRAFQAKYQWRFNANCTLYHLNHTRDTEAIANSMMKNILFLYKKFDKPKSILALLNFYNGVISLNEFNKICSLDIDKEQIELEDYFLNLKDYINKSQLINWKKNELNSTI